MQTISSECLLLCFKWVHGIREGKSVEMQSQDARRVAKNSTVKKIGWLTSYD